MAERDEVLPRAVEELEELASYYDTHDTSGEMANGSGSTPGP
ncbi:MULTISPECIES: hypothetical protein [Actinosynnema]|nr:hypothetical protein [Actinosynnema pretiosum]